MLVNSAAFLVHVEALLRLHQRRPALNKVEVAHQAVRVEVVLLDVERRGHISVRVHLRRTEHQPEILVFNHASRSGVKQVALLVRCLAFLVVVKSRRVLKQDQVALGVAVQSAQYVALVKGPRAGGDLRSVGLSRVQLLVALEVLLVLGGLLSRVLLDGRIALLLLGQLLLLELGLLLLCLHLLYGLQFL